MQITLSRQNRLIRMCRYQVPPSTWPKKIREFRTYQFVDDYVAKFVAGVAGGIGEPLRSYLVYYAVQVPKRLPRKEPAVMQLWVRLFPRVEIGFRFSRVRRQLFLHVF